MVVAWKGTTRAVLWWLLWGVASWVVDERLCAAGGLVLVDFLPTCG